MDLHFSGYKNIELTTFGAPRLGNIQLSNFFVNGPIKSYRIVHGEDIVPQIPPLFINYYHIPQEYWFTKNSADKYKVCNPWNGEDITCSRSTNYVSIEDHMIYMGLRLGDGAPHKCI